MAVFKNDQEKEKFVRSFLNEKIKIGELKDAKITNGKLGCYLSSNHGLLKYVALGVNESNVFLRFWEKEDKKPRKENIEKRRSYLEDYYKKIQQDLGPEVKYKSFNNVNHYICDKDNNTLKGFCAYYPDRKSVKELEKDTNRLYDVYCHMKDAVDGSKILELIQKSKGVISSGISKNGEKEMSVLEANKEKIELNMILYGPPGTGKTFNTMAYAVAICEDKDVEEVKKEMQDNYGSVKQRYDVLKEEGRIEFVTFHQSYGYEDFIEGIKPILEGDDNSGLNYELHPGVFKNFCESAEKSFTNSLPDSEKGDAFDKSWNLLLKKLNESEDEKISIKLKNKKSFSVGYNGTRTGLYAGGRRYFNKKQLRNIFNGQQGVPSGALDSYRRRIIEYMIKHCGLPGNTRKKEADNNAKQNYVFIIDEINRGNISKIFGELITLIEPSKRLGEKESMKVTLPCSGDVFGVPNNVYILGTMNTADRSIAMIDTALRRRFNFVEMMPDTDELSSPLKDNAFDDIDVRKMLKIINERIEYLYDREHTIGHAFFIGVDTLDKLSSVFKNKVIPLLQEYFYDDYKKIRLVLGDNGKDEKNQFIKKAHPQKELFKKGDDDDDLNKEKNIYKINQDAFDDPKSYKGII